ncbi:hypothetical protein H4R26_001725 [Coemansia thaxteri]|uniref:NmrA-like domain-containing protein n=1 Tax=Coemansia thaxteri TaxID=2663907 RepID=A0A9W8BL63_9FUNG|nr:hypothetical protein H4R26_001725 [Coemansia thaxteri]KAJ2485784.1 hypothetical protein EV174_001514 [Coemansia sp. RSA 2320]
MSTFASILDASSRKSVLVTACDTFPGYMIARELLKRKGKHFERVCAGYYKENKLVHLLKHEGAHCIHMEISKPDAICDAYHKADVVIVVPPVSDEHWAKKDGCVYLHAATKAGVKGLVLCSKINADKMRDLKMLAPLHEMEMTLEKIRNQIECVSLLRCSLHTDMLWLFRHQIAEDRKLCLSVGKDAKCAPMVEKDGAHGLYNMLTDSKFPPGVYELTGPEKVSMADMAHKASSAIGKDIKYEHVSRKDMEHYLHKQDEICSSEICFIGDLLEAMGKNVLDVCTDDLKKLLQQDPMSVKEFLEKNSKDFKPRSSSTEATAA